MTQPVTPELLSRLLDEQGAALELFASQWTEMPEDCVQEAFLQLVRQPKTPDMVVPWLFRVVRNRAALRTIDAIRMYAAAHDNALPTSLDMIDEVLVPNDSLFEKPFEYRIERGEAVLEMLPRSQEIRQIDVVRYVIQIAKYSPDLRSSNSIEDQPNVPTSYTRCNRHHAGHHSLPGER